MEKNQDNTKPLPENVSFEQALKELEAIVRKLESDAAHVGMRLLPTCPSIIAGDLNCAAGSHDAVSVLGQLGPTVDLVAATTETTPRSLSFPLGVWSRRKRTYLVRTPTKRLDYVLVREAGAGRAAAHVSQALAHSAATAAPLSDHAPVLMHLRYGDEGAR